MNPYVLMAIGCFACTVIQGVDSFFSLRERFRQKSSEADMASSKTLAGWFAFSLVIGAVGTAIIGTALLMYHPKPVTVEKPVIVEKIIPCPPAETGAASTHGAQSPANSGSGNTTTYGSQPAQPPPPSNKPKSDK
jgi:hypothetical protein